MKSSHGRYALDKLKPCPACGAMTTDAERRGGYRQGPAPALCMPCQEAHPGERWCKRCAAFESTRLCPVQLRARDDARREAGAYRSDVTISCPSCGKTGTHFELHGRPGRGGPVCAECKAAHEGERWCTQHRRFEPVEWFANPGAQRCSRTKNPCPSCERVLTRQQFAGTAEKPRGALAAVCAECRVAHPGERWCKGHVRFEPVEEFSLWSRGSCWSIDRPRAQGVIDADELAEAHGVWPGACMCCFATGRRLVTDHDHDCCPGRRSCGRCVRGLICYDCNNVEGKIRQVYGPPFPRLIQEYLDRGDAYRARLIA